MLILFYLKTHVFHRRLEIVITGLDKIAFLLSGSGKTCGAWSFPHKVNISPFSYML